MMNHRRGSTLAKNAHKPRHWHLAATLLCCLVVRLTTFYVTHILHESEYKYIDQLIGVDREGSPDHGGLQKRARLSHQGEGTHYLHAEQINDTKDLQEYFQRNKRNRKMKQFLVKHDSMHYSFNSDLYNLKYLYESDLLGRLSADVYSSLTVRINPLLLKALQFVLFRGICKGDRNGGNAKRGAYPSPLNRPEVRFFLLICAVDLLIGVFLFLIVQRLATWEAYFRYKNQKRSLSPQRSIQNLIATLVVNAMLLYVTSFHFILVLIGVNNLVVYIHQGIIYKHKLKVPINSLQMFLILLQNLALLIATLGVYALLLLASAYVNSGSWSFLNNTLINEYKVLFLLPNLGNYWYLFSTMFRDYYHSFLFLFHFHVFLYPLPLLFRLVKTPLIYLKIMICIALVFHPNITVNDIVFSLLLLVIDYKRTVYAIPFAKLIIILLGNLGLFFVTTNLWLRKNTGNANYVFFNQLIVFNITTFIITSSIKFYIRVQTPERQLQEGKCIVVSQEKNKFNLFQTLKETFM
ncbi:Uncharacterized protein PCOAH_00042780 [Plasmodium coatneyi]|uniref:GPI transamidase subunit PIG-U n=1 Tax=Plasmodium coatneyi TaxID=208452 RepID=A0A1B1E5Q9_9APIC|nr:Uncharacterized protein PCOAH_00042780 [Plasmodium coatneyi]ANQ10307.1 Uncharacterized protein PCOAH_00042780 [Plasmodium coatneyi]